MDYRGKLTELGIDVYKVRGKQGKVICPKCSHTRKKKTDPCLSVNIEDGWYNCHNGCGFTGNVREDEYRKRAESYVRPKLINQTECTNDVVKWFRDRGINQMTLIKNKVMSGLTWLPQTQQQEYCVQFTYWRNNELVNIKHRDGNKNFRLEKDAELIFYGLDNLKEDDKYIIITEGECFRGDSEILTKKGWVRFDQYNGFDEVMSVNDDMTSRFEKPNHIVKKEYSGKLVKFSNHQKFYSLTTPGHNLVVCKNNSGKIYKQKANELKTGYSVPRVVNHNGHGVDLTDDELRLCIAVSADFTIRKEGDLYCALKKDRKIKRLKEILDNCGIIYSCNIDIRGYSSFFIRRGNAPSYVFKEFPLNWVSETSLRQKKLIIDEITFWDGNSVPNREQIEYSSSIYNNAVFIQTLSHLCGYTSTIIKRVNKFGYWFKVSILFNKTHTDTQSLINNKEEINHDGFVYCVNVPTGKILVRQNECISVSGNCDSLSFYESGIHYGLSVPNGASKQRADDNRTIDLQYLENSWDYFNNDKIIILALDNDTPGILLREELARRLGRERCRKVDFKDCKDANEYLMKYGPTELRKVVIEANLIEYPLEGIVTAEEVWDEVDILMNEGLSKGLTTKVFHALDDHISFEGSKLCTVTGIPNSGKSPFVDQIMIILSIHYGWKWGVCSMESKPLKKYIVKLAEKISGQWIRPGKTLDETRKMRIKDFINNHFYFIEANEQNDEQETLDFILNASTQLVRKFGIKGLVIDPWNKIEHDQPKGESETNYVSKTLDKLIRHIRNHDLFTFLVAHPAKPKKTKMGEYEMPDLYSISGSANFFNKSDMGITVHRDYKSEQTIIWINKMKDDHLGKTGKIGFKYNFGNGRLYETHNGKPDYGFWLDSLIFDNDLPVLSNVDDDSLPF